MADPTELYGRWLTAGDLVFDIGANVGLRSAVFLQMGCRVVAVEPQRGCLLQVDSRAERIQAAVGASAGEQTMFVSTDYNYLSTLSRDYIERSADSWPAGYDREERVEVVTLDRLIEEYGVPAFCKIDVEGYEEEVFKGLTVALPALSFEVHPFDVEKITACLDRLAGLGDYALSYSDRESFEMEDWTGRVGLFGDIYAELRP